MESCFDVAIVGGGIIGVSTAYNIQMEFPHLRILLLEKEAELAKHQSGHNSGVIHSGLYYKPGSKKAYYCYRGRKRLIEFAREYGIKHDICGKVVVATADSEIQYLQQLKNNGIENGLTGIEAVNTDQIKEIEPFVEAKSGLFVPDTGIIDFVSVTIKMAELVRSINTNSTILTSREVSAVEILDGVKSLKTRNGTYKARKVIFCGGLQADRLARMDDVKLQEKIVGFRGDYYELAEHAKAKVKNLIYPVPDPKFPFLGVHFTRMIDGSVECGPNAVFTFKREGYKKTDFNLVDTVDALTYSGTWRLLLDNFSFAFNEYRRAFSKRLFLQSLQKIIPSLTMDDIVPGRAGVRAQYLGKDGDTREDFKIEYMADSIHVLNAPSPAATASLAIGEEIKNMAIKHFKLV
jgi:(S)-2-hydroxyglutarate dehydrogenase